MTFNELKDRVGGTVVVDNPEAAISAAYTSDLLSDVMGHCGDESVLITIQNHLNAIYSRLSAIEDKMAALHPTSTQP